MLFQIRTLILDVGEVRVLNVPKEGSYATIVLEGALGFLVIIPLRMEASIAFYRIDQVRFAQLHSVRHHFQEFQVALFPGIEQQSGLGLHFLELPLQNGILVGSLPRKPTIIRSIVMIDPHQSR